MRVTPMTLGLIAALITVPFAVAPAHAVSWSYVAIDKDSTRRWAYDADSVEYDDQTATFIGRYEMNNGEWSLSVMQVRCNEAMFRYSYPDYYNGTRLVRRDKTVYDWFYITKETIASKYFRKVCVTS